MFQGCSGVVPGCSGLFRAVPGCSGGVPGVFRGVPGVFRGVPGVFRVLQTPVSSRQYLFDMLSIGPWQSPVLIGSTRKTDVIFKMMAVFSHIESVEINLNSKVDTYQANRV